MNVWRPRQGARGPRCVTPGPHPVIIAGLGIRPVRQLRLLPTIRRPMVVTERFFWRKGTMRPTEATGRDDIPERNYSVPAPATARVTVDTRGTVTGWDEGARQLLGYTAKDVVGRSVRDLLDEEPSVEEVSAAAAAPVAEGAVALLHQDGHRVTVNLLVHRRTPDSEVGEGDGGWLLLAAVAPQSSPSYDNDLVKWAFAGSGAALYDADLRLRLASTDMQRELGLSEETLRGLHITDFVPLAPGPETEQRMRRVLATGEQDQVEAVLRLHGIRGDRTWIISLIPVRDTDGTVRGVLASGQDMTEEYQARNRLALLNEANASIGTTLDLGRTAQELADVAVPGLSDAVHVDLLPSAQDGEDPQPGSLTSPITLRRVACRSVLEGNPEPVIRPGAVAVYPKDSLTAECLDSGRPLIRELPPSAPADWERDNPEHAARLRKDGIHSVLAVPISARGINLGVVTFSRHRCPEPFEQDDLLLAEEITARAAVCIDNARRYIRDRRTSLTLQRSLLPRRPPPQAAVEVASRYLRRSGVCPWGELKEPAHRSPGRTRVGARSLIPPAGQEAAVGFVPPELGPVTGVSHSRISVAWPHTQRHDPVDAFAFRCCAPCAGGDLILDSCSRPIHITRSSSPAGRVGLLFPLHAPTGRTTKNSNAAQGIRNTGQPPPRWGT